MSLRNIGITLPEKWLEVLNVYLATCYIITCEKSCLSASVLQSAGKNRKLIFNQMKPINVICLAAFLLLSVAGKAQCPGNEASVGGIKSGEFEKTVFQSQTQMDAGSHCGIFDTTTIVDSFQVLVIRNTVILYKGKNTGGVFSSSLKDVMQTITTNDKILFFDICGTGPDGKNVFLNPLEYRITEH